MNTKLIEELREFEKWFSTFTARLYDSGQIKKDDFIWEVFREFRRMMDCHPTPTEDIVGELKQVIKYVGKKSADPWDNGYATCAHEVEEIIRKYEGGK